jgi:hypothetical protein
MFSNVNISARTLTSAMEKEAKRQFCYQITFQNREPRFSTKQGLIPETGTHVWWLFAARWNSFIRAKETLSLKSVSSKVTLDDQGSIPGRGKGFFL